MDTRIYGERKEINQKEIQNLYRSRIGKSKEIHIDSPVVLSGDTNPENIELWTKEECKNWLPLFELKKDSIVLELGFGTGRMTKFLIPENGIYVGIDYVSEFVELIKEREDILHKENAQFLNSSFEEFLWDEKRNNDKKKFTHFFLSGGVLMYINDSTVNQCINKLEELLTENSVIYISEPIALKTRLTLNSFYSETIKNNYSAIYRTEDEYMDIFKPFIEKGFYVEVSQPFFEKDIKKQKETLQWIFILKRKRK